MSESLPARNCVLFGEVKAIKKTQMMVVLAPLSNLVMATLWRIRITMGDVAMNLGFLMSVR